MTVSHQRSAMITPMIGAVIGAVAVAALVAGCGNAPGPESAALPFPASLTPTEQPSVPGTPSAAATAVQPVPAPHPAPAAQPTAPGDAPPAISVPLPWPVSGSSRVAALQSEVDGGAQPWLLDPTEVGTSYALAAHGWNDTTTTRDGASVVTVHAPDGKRLVLHVIQPGRSGPGGIWVVTADTPA